MQKRGRKSQAEIITTILIILVVLVAIVIVWNVVKRITKSSSEQIAINTFSVNLEVKDAEVYGSGMQNGASVTIHRDHGAGTINSLKVIFYDKSGASQFITLTNNLPQPLETKTYSLDTSNITLGIYRISVVPLIGNSYGFEATEEESSISTNSSGDRIPDTPTTAPECEDFSDCPADGIITNSDFCLSEDVYQINRDYTNCVDNVCTYSNTNALLTNCLADELSAPVCCNGNQVCKDLTSHACAETPAPLGCKDTTQTGVVQETCEYGCLNGACLTATSLVVKSWWKFDNDLSDYVGNLDNGVMAVLGTVDSAVYEGGALKLPGDTEYVELGVSINDTITDDLDFIQNTPSVTFSGWIYLDDVTQDHAIFGNGLGGTTKTRWDIKFFATGPKNIYSAIGNEATYSFASTPGSSIPNANQWYHIVVTHGTDLIRDIYINGVKQTTTCSPTCSTSSILNLANTWKIGTAYKNVNNVALKGKIDNFMVFNKKLAQDEVTAIYNSQCTGKGMTTCPLP